MTVIIGVTALPEAQLEPLLLDLTTNVGHAVVNIVLDAWEVDLHQCPGTESDAKATAWKCISRSVSSHPSSPSHYHPATTVH